uniref:Uncharacterized protein n=1 Tax=Plectus sambesii TaxID=2011161 RepID=A0A914UIP3_9BILA
MASRFYVDVTLTSIHERYAFGSFENKQSVFIPGAANLIHPKWKKMTDLFKLGQLVAVIAREQETITNGCQYIALSVCSYEEVIETTGEVIKADVGADRKSFLLRTPNQGEVFLPCSAINKYRKSLLQGGLNNTPSALRVGDRVKVYIMRQPPPLTVPDASSWSVVKLSDHASSEEFEPVAHSINKENRWSSVDSSETSGEKADSEEDNGVFKIEVGSRGEREGDTVSRSINKGHSENGGDKRVKSPVSPNSFHFPSVAASKGSDDSFVS